MTRARERFSVFAFAAILLALYVGLAFVAGWLLGRVLAVTASVFGGVHDFFHSTAWEITRAAVVGVRPALLDRDDRVGEEGREAAHREHPGRLARRR